MDSFIEFYIGPSTKKRRTGSDPDAETHLMKDGVRAIQLLASATSSFVHNYQPGPTSGNNRSLTMWETAGDLVAASLKSECLKKHSKIEVSIKMKQRENNH